MSLALPGQDLHLLPLGGTGEIGMNLNAYHHQGRWLLVDCGVMFEREDAHRQHVLYPDASFLAERRDALVGLVITHAHQDHLGAVRDLWPQLRCPVYGTRFAIEMLRGPLQEAGLSDAVPLRVIGERDQLRLGPFSLQRVPLTHSTVEMERPGDSNVGGDGPAHRRLEARSRPPGRTDHGRGGPQGAGRGGRPCRGLRQHQRDGGGLDPLGGGASSRP